MSDENKTEPKKADTTGVKTLLAESENNDANNPLSGITFQTLMTKMEGQIKKALPKHLTVERFIRIAMTAYSRNSKLQECDGMTIISACMEAAQLGLEPNTAIGHAYIIPYKNNKTGKMEAQFQVGYQGIIELCYRSGEYKQIAAYEVYSNDEFEYELGLNQKLIHKPAKESEGEPVYYYAIFKRKDGGEGFFVMSKEQGISYGRKYSYAFQKGWDSIWKSDISSMVMKTCLKKALKYAQKSIEVARLYAVDNTVKRDLSDNMLDVNNEVELVE